jgi:hypothetical protein
LEQISILMSFRVERVVMTLPQAQLMVVSVYTGWMPSFIKPFILLAIGPISDRTGV